MLTRAFFHTAIGFGSVLLIDQTLDFGRILKIIQIGVRV